MGAAVRPNHRQQVLRCPPHFEARRETCLRPFAHLLSLIGRQRQPALQQADGAIQRIGGHQSRAVGVDLAPDVDLVRDQHRRADRQRLGDGNAEVFLVRGQDEGFGGEEGAPFQIALQQAGPGDALTHAEPLRAGMQPRRPARYPRGRDHCLAACSTRSTRTDSPTVS